MKAMIIIGSKSDEAVMQECQNWLNWFGIENEIVIASAHRNADLVSDLMKGAKKTRFDIRSVETASLSARSQR